jgi:hypothetical protein
MLGLGPRDALDVSHRLFTRMRGFIGFTIGTQAVAKNDGIEGDAHLGQQLPTARAT